MRASLLRTLALVVSLALPLLAPRAVDAQDKPIMAVFDIENRESGLSEKALQNLTDYMVGLLAESGYAIIPRDQLKARLLEQKQDSHKTCYDQNCQVELGRELAAQKSLASQIFQLGGVCRITLTLFDLRKSATEQAVTAKAECTERDLVAAIEEAVKKLSAGGNRAAAPLPPSAASSPQPAPLQPLAAATTEPGLPPPQTSPVEQVQEQKPPVVEQPSAEPGPSHSSFRLQALFGLGAGGKAKLKTDLAELTTDMAASYGAGVGLVYLPIRYLGIGARIHLDSLKAKDAPERTKSLQMLLVPTSRFPLGDLELSLSLPLGLAVLIPADSSVDKQTGFELHLLGGASYWLSERLGVFAELGLGTTVYTESKDRAGASVDAKVTLTEMRFQMGVVFGL